MILENPVRMLTAADASTLDSRQAELVTEWPGQRSGVDRLRHCVRIDSNPPPVMQRLPMVPLAHKQVAGNFRLIIWRRQATAACVDGGNGSHMHAQHQPGVN